MVHVLKKYRKNNLTWQYLFNVIHCTAKKEKATKARKIKNLNIQMRLESNESTHTVLYLWLWYRFLFKVIFFTSHTFFWWAVLHPLLNNMYSMQLPNTLYRVETVAQSILLFALVAYI